ncbi:MULTISPECIES: 7-carboxy-7-deazaguanine synthase [Candidatus Ichthyocystis]|uniref:7-carboxy-7-deazaguanine synthase n=1 Tax=Candidatus Ichthyocystis hellenicum TaxID=1561003 RepID=A0A0S4M426_9BURK|nr:MULTISPECIES: 7-carboxy-7-deazaguanine synthase [Ichthyocystis]CUT16904.1 7-cyano-7-deazaguanosine reductase [Candidatus Ichthyocystis hellenicum]
MGYQVKEIFYTLQGEGFHAGRPAVFCRFVGCNLWSGKEKNRKEAICQFCDTDFVLPYGDGGGRFSSGRELALHISSFWPDSDAKRNFFVVLTGGEPLLQVDQELIDSLHEEQAVVAVETNGTIVPECVFDWICVSPKSCAPLNLLRGNELKVVVPQCGQDFFYYETLGFDYFFVQPMYGPDLEENTRLAVSHCKLNPKWRVSLQLHKVLGIA